MKKVLLFAALCALAAGCASSSANQSGSASFDQYQILDQEFEGVAVPNDNYDRVASYEDQVMGTSYIQSTDRSNTGKKPSRKMTGKKVVVDEQGNQLSEGATAPVTDQETIPADPEEN